MWNVVVRDSNGDTVLIGSDLSYEEAMELEREFTTTNNLVILYSGVD